MGVLGQSSQPDGRRPGEPRASDFDVAVQGGHLSAARADVGHNKVENEAHQVQP